MIVLDIHSHHAAPYPYGVINVRPGEFNPMEGQLYSVGIHPWDTGSEPGEDIWNKLESIVSHHQVVAIGECGIDLMQGGPLFSQMQIFRRQIDLSEKTGKPLIIHNVKGNDIILGLKKDLHVSKPWMIHGFRGKPSVAEMFFNKGIYLSYGEKFNSESLSIMPEELILAETDESRLPIEEIIKRISDASGKELKEIVEINSKRFLDMVN